MNNLIKTQYLKNLLNKQSRLLIKSTVGNFLDLTVRKTPKGPKFVCSEEPKYKVIGSAQTIKELDLKPLFLNKNGYSEVISPVREVYLTISRDTEAELFLNQDRIQSQYSIFADCANKVHKNTVSTLKKDSKEILSIDLPVYNALNIPCKVYYPELDEVFYALSSYCGKKPLKRSKNLPFNSIINSDLMFLEGARFVIVVSKYEIVKITTFEKYLAEFLKDYDQNSEYIYIY